MVYLRFKKDAAGLPVYAEVPYIAGPFVDRYVSHVESIFWVGTYLREKVKI
jgi:hypothetical protein